MPGLASALDRSGRWAAAPSAYLLSFAAGPLVGGAVIEAADHAGLALVSVAITAAAWGWPWSSIGVLAPRPPQHFRPTLRG